MDSLKEVVSLLGAVVGLITALIPVMAFLNDPKRRRLRNRRRAAERAIEHPFEVVEPEAIIDRQASNVAAQPIVNRADFEKARAIVRAPAYVMMSVGILGLASNLMMAGMGFVDQFVTPIGLGINEKPPMAGLEAGPGPGQGFMAERYGRETKEPVISEKGSVVMALLMFLSLGAASGVSVWASIQMLSLRHYGLAVAGTIAVMPGTFLCCLMGVPAGIWSLVVLLKPEVSGAFR